ncbi:MAG: hypothetical protein KGN34_13820 [Sphingomonadales bacterium]|nr:hypothetical protein [Sphingomonadales bacterium]
MKSALKLIAFTHVDPDDGIAALLELALAALDESGSHLAAAYVDLALVSHAAIREERRAREFAGIGAFQ